MAITDLAIVKTVSKMYDITGIIAPTVATVGEVGDIYLDTVTGLTYECTEVAAGPVYTWTADTSDDALINLYIEKAELTYLRIRGIDFETDDDDNIVYPDGADTTAAEMVCYLMGYGEFTGRGNVSENLGGKSKTADKKIFGFPIDIVGDIQPYQHTTYGTVSNEGLS